MMILMLKGGSGSGNHGHRGRPGQVGGSSPQPTNVHAAAEASQSVVPSAKITDEQQARAIWQTLFADRTIPIEVAYAGKAISSTVFFDATNDHAFTVGSWGEHGKKRKERTFLLSRAQLMDNIVPTIAAPEKVWDHGGADLFIRKVIGGAHYIVVLRWRPKRDGYEFDTAYPVTGEDLVALRRRGAQPSRPKKTKTPLRKAVGVPSSALLVFGSSFAGHPGAFQRPPGHATWAATPAPLRYLAELAAFFKALSPGERWISVKAPGHDKGQPVLIRQMPDGSAKVIGGAGGSMNHLRLMDRLIPTLERPMKVLGQVGSDVLVSFGKLADGGAYTAAFTIKGPGRYSFSSAYPRSKTQIDRLMQEYRERPSANLPANADGLAKSHPLPRKDRGLMGLTFAVPSGHGQVSRSDPAAIPQHPYGSGVEGYPLAAVQYLDVFTTIFKALSPGERWISVKAPGHDKGQPVLIRQMPDGSAKVIGGAGGSMNH